jgi:hypothetical protein
MTLPKMTFALKTIFPLLFLALVWTGCDSSEDGEGELPPPVPEASIFNPLPDLFRDNPASDDGSNYSAAVNLIEDVVINMAPIVDLPFAMTSVSFQGNPFLSDEGAWVWQVVTFFRERPYSYELFARQAQDEEFNWNLLISGPDPLTNIQLAGFILYTINSETDRSGTWSVFYNDQGISQFGMSGSYDVVSETEWSLEFSTSESYQPGGGDVVMFSRSGDTISYSWNDISAGQTHLFEWNPNTLAGSITSPNFKGGDKSCWNDALTDTDC